MFGYFSIILLLLSSSLVHLWPKNTFYMKSIILNLLRFVLWSMYGWSWCMLHGHQWVFLLLIFYLVLLSTVERRPLKSLPIIMKLSISIFNSISFYFIYFAALLLVHTHLWTLFFMMDWPFSHYIISLPISSNYNLVTPAFFFINVCMI